ncbi:MAG: DUF1552 domain-containing protein [Myxococcales bacterium FL481]|nr:MAG: DUF1552 domain-containing protein [Myxococcales bacterium FL481]
MKTNLRTRRMFLMGAGGAALSLPLLPSLLPRGLQSRAHAAAPDVPRRFVAIKTYSGTPLRAFYPGDGAGGFTAHPDDGRAMLTDQLPEATGRHADGNEYYGTWAPLGAFADSGISRIFSTSFNRHHDAMTLYRGLDVMPNLNHNHGAMLGNFGLRTNGTGGPYLDAQINVTIDQVMARSPQVYPTAPAGPRILHLGSRRNTFSYAPVDPNDLLATGLQAISQAQAYVNPRTAFDAVLAGLGHEDPGESELEPGVLMIDRVLDDYRRVAASAQLSSADRQLLDQHVTRLTELEARLKSQGGGGDCPELPRPDDLDAGGEFEADVTEVTQLFDDMVDIIVVALSCDVTRLCTLDISKMIVNDNGNVFGMGDSENADSAGRENWHYQAHTWDENAIRWLSLGAEWVAQHVIMRLLDGLAAAPQADGESLLHHALVVWSNELSFNHLNYSLPTAVWGRAGGYLKSGRYIDYIDHNRPVRFRQHDGPVIEGVQFNRFVNTMAQAMGLDPAEYELTPGAGFGESRHLEKDELWAIDYDHGKIGDILPDVAT